jgi:hypothetical protein
MAMILLGHNPCFICWYTRAFQVDI